MEVKSLAVFAFGGGYVSGQLETEETNCRTWVKRFGGVAVSIGYRYVRKLRARLGRIG
jgi:acetyl esterase/lipase